MTKAVRNYIIAQICINTIFIIGALFLIFYKKLNIVDLCNILAISCTIFGAASLLIMRKTPYFKSFIPSTFTALIFSMIFIINQSEAKLFLPIFCLVWMGVFACFNIQVGFDLIKTKQRKIGKISIFHSLLPFIYSIIIIISYNSNIKNIYPVLGIFVLAYGINQLITYGIFYKNHQLFAKFLIDRLNSKD